MTESGRTNVPVSVIEKVASQVVSEVEDVGAAAGGFLGIGGRRDFDGSPDVRAEVYGKDLVLEVRMGIRLGAPVEAVSRRVREHVVTQMANLTGLRVRQIDLAVTWVHEDIAAREKVLR